MPSLSHIAATPSFALTSFANLILGRKVVKQIVPEVTFPIDLLKRPRRVRCRLEIYQRLLSVRACLVENRLRSIHLQLWIASMGELWSERSLLLCCCALRTVARLSFQSGVTPVFSFCGFLLPFDKRGLVLPFRSKNRIWKSVIVVNRLLVNPPSVKVLVAKIQILLWLV